MIYRADFGFHGRLMAPVAEDALRQEPSLTLCTVDMFAQWSGPFSRRVFAEIAGTAAFHRIAARAQADSTVSIRISVYVVWLEPLEFPSHRPDWHIDRIGGLHQDGAIERVDLRDPLEFSSFVLSSVFLTESEREDDRGSPSTEFLLATFPGQSPELWADMREMHNDIDTALSENPEFPIVKAGNRTIASFSPRTVHRPGQATVPGWRYLMRLGLYTTEEACSPYPDHFVFYNPVWSAATRSTSFRRAGDREARSTPTVRSVSLRTRDGRIAAARFADENSLLTGQRPAGVELRDLVSSAARIGFQQVSGCAMGYKREISG